MSDDLKKKRRHLKANSPRNYEVGYGKPPAEHRFKKGQSGNSRGRPKGQKSQINLSEERLKDIIVGEAYRNIKLVENGKPITLSVAEAIIRSMAVNAVKGEARAQKMFTHLLTETENSNKRLADQWLQTAIDYKIDWTEEIERCKRLGLPIPAPIPHPDHIEIDMNTGQVIVKGPFTKEEKADWDKLEVRRRQALEEIQQLRALLEDTKDESVRKFIEDDLALEESILETLNKTLSRRKW